MYEREGYLGVDERVAVSYVVDAVAVPTQPEVQERLGMLRLPHQLMVCHLRDHQ